MLRLGLVWMGLGLVGLGLELGLGLKLWIGFGLGLGLGPGGGGTLGMILLNVGKYLSRHFSGRGGRAIADLRRRRNGP